MAAALAIRADVLLDRLCRSVFIVMLGVPPLREDISRCLPLAARSAPVTTQAARLALEIEGVMWCGTAGVAAGQRVSEGAARMTQGVV